MLSAVEALISNNMNETLEFLDKLNWVLKPISSLVIFLFTTGTGNMVLVTGFLAIIGLSAYNALKERNLAYKAAKVDGAAYVPFSETIYLVGRVVAKMFLRVITNLPVFLAVFVFLMMVVGISKGIDSMGEFVENQQRIKELQSILKQLDQRYKVAEVEVTGYNAITDETDLVIRFYDYAHQGFSNANQTLTIQGTDIYFDAIVLNFEYSEIATGNAKNLVLPYRVFSEKVPQEKGIPLKLMDKNGIPLIFKRDETDIYGMGRIKYSQRVKEILSYITDKEKARMAGIRSIFGNAVHKNLHPGNIINIWVEQTGGLVIKDAIAF